MVPSTWYLFVLKYKIIFRSLFFYNLAYNAVFKKIKLTRKKNKVEEYFSLDARNVNWWLTAAKKNCTAAIYTLCWEKRMCWPYTNCKQVTFSHHIWENFHLSIVDILNICYIFHCLGCSINLILISFANLELSPFSHSNCKITVRSFLSEFFSVRENLAFIKILTFLLSTTFWLEGDDLYSLPTYLV